MQLRNYLRLLGICILSAAFISWTLNNIENTNKNHISHTTVDSSSAKNEAAAKDFVYDSLNLDGKGLSHDAFEHAINGFNKLEKEGVLKNDSILTIIDFDQPSYQKRLYIIDIKNYKILFNTWVAHGKNTGKQTANFFSNTNASYKSSLGIYITDETYFGSKGYSLKLKGLEENLNSNAYKRAIVMHGAPYVNEEWINTQGYIGRSHGCPAVPVALAKPIIQTIKDGSCLFIYNKSYKPSPRFSIG